MTPKDFEEWTAGIFNIAKLLGLVAVGFWTYHEWNISIFPKESYEDFARRASRRTDLSVFIEKSKIDTLDVQRSAGNLERIIISTKINFTNDKDFPVKLMVDSFSLRKGVAGKLDFYKKTTEESDVNWSWITNESVPLQRAFGSFLIYQPFVLEPKGKLILPIYFPLSIRWNRKENYRFIELDVQLSIEGIHPTTGAPIVNSKKIKYLVIKLMVRNKGKRVSVIESDSSYAATRG